MSTITDLPIGAKLKFGAYSINGEIPHKICWIKVHRDGTILTEFMEDLCAFDAKESDNPNEYRMKYGNNRYSLSNIQQFLNAENIEWFRLTHKYDVSPENHLVYDGKNGYVHKYGFLHYFKEWEIESIAESKVKTALPDKDILTDGEKYDTFCAKVFIPSKTNMGYGTENNIQEGNVWDLFARVAIRSCHFSPKNPAYRNEEWGYYLRTPVHNSTSIANFVDPYGEICNAYACGSLGIRPALKLKTKTIISDEPDGDGYYAVLSAPPEIIEIDEKTSSRY